jgi:Protein of unknown function (DUF5132)
MNMSRSKLDGHADLEHDSAKSIPEPADPIDAAETDQSDIVLTAATVAVVGVGVIVFEAALLPGLVLGVAAMLAPKVLPNLGAALNPLFKSTVRGAYQVGRKTKEMMAEAHEHVNDIVAEVHSDAEEKAPPAAKAAA